MDLRSVDLLYLACNRLEFTRESFEALLANTKWECVHELFVYDDGSVDGTREWLEQAIERVPAAHRLVRTRYGSPVSAMVHFIESASAPMLAKTDNDAMLPSGWLETSLGVFERHPQLDFLGIEAMYPHEEGVGVERGYEPAQFISGLGLYRRQAFERGRPQAYQKWFGLEEWQVAQGHGLVRGWIRPALPVFLLDRIPFEPWAGHARGYVTRGWQRTWPKYASECTLWRWWNSATRGQAIHPVQRAGTGGGGAAEPARLEGGRPGGLANSGRPFHVVVLSARGSNLVACVQAVLAQEPALRPEQIVVVDDGARREAEAHLPGVQWVTGLKPFVFARNANLGIRAAGTDVILLNDDARLMSHDGFARMYREVLARPDVGLCSAAVQGIVGNPAQLSRPGAGVRWEARSLAFVCVYIPLGVYRRIGELDERFVGYGFEDNDYCLRVRRAGLRLAVFDGCIVEHGKSAPSSFRIRPDIHHLYRMNERLFFHKWGRAQ